MQTGFLPPRQGTERGSRDRGGRVDWHAHPAKPDSVSLPWGPRLQPFPTQGRLTRPAPSPRRLQTHNCRSHLLARTGAPWRGGLWACWPETLDPAVCSSVPGNVGVTQPR